METWYVAGVTWLAFHVPTVFLIYVGMMMVGSAAEAAIRLPPDGSWKGDAERLAARAKPSRTMQVLSDAMNIGKTIMGMGMGIGVMSMVLGVNTLITYWWGCAIAMVVAILCHWDIHQTPGIWRHSLTWKLASGLSSMLLLWTAGVFMMALLGKFLIY